MRKKTIYTKSSGNLFADLGFDNPGECLAKVDLAIQIDQLIQQKGPIQAANKFRFNMPLSTLQMAQIDTPLGAMLAVADQQALLALRFIDSIDSGGELAPIIPVPQSEIIQQITQELADYFAGKLRQFQTPVQLSGTDFQKQVWQQLTQIPYGQTQTYGALAQALQQPAAVRAVGNANGANYLTLIIPCHRVVRAGGQLGGYAAGLARKSWLLKHEQKSTSFLSNF